MLEFQQAVEGALVKALGPDLSPELRSRLRAAGLDLDRPLLPAYDAADFHRWLKLAALHVYPDRSPDEALRALGRRSLGGMEQTLVGKATGAALRLIGPMRTMQRIGRIFRSSNNYAEVTARELSERSVEIHIPETFGVSNYYLGVIEGSSGLIGAKNLRLTPRSNGARGCFIVAEWE